MIITASSFSAQSYFRRSHTAGLITEKLQYGKVLFFWRSPQQTDEAWPSIWHWANKCGSSLVVKRVKGYHGNNDKKFTEKIRDKR